MKKFLKSFGRFIAYTAFFVGALLLFIYMTLPLDEARDFLVRKASDEYSADLVFADEDSLRVCGLACIEARNVTFTVRPTAEELAEYQEAQRLWKEWKEADAAAKGEGKEPAAEGVPSAAVPSAPEGTAPTEAVVEGEPGADGAPGSAEAPASETAKAKSVARSTGVAKGPAPRKPEWPAQPIELASLRAELSPFKMMSGLVEGRLQAELLGGTLDAEVSQTREEMKIKGTLENVDMAQLTVIERLLPLPMAGVVSIDLDLAVELDDQKKPKLDLITGTASLHVRSAFVGPGQIESKKLGAFPYFDVPKTRIDDLGGRIVFEKRRATFEEFAIRGKDIEGEITGYIQLAADLSRWGARGHLRFKFSDAFLEQHRDVKTAMTSIPYLKQGQTEGYTGFGVTGEFGKLKWKPTKISPYKSRSREPRAEKESPDGEGAGTDKRPATVDRTAKNRPPRRGLDKPAKGETDSPPPLERTTGLAPEVATGRKPFMRPPTVVPDAPPAPEEPAEETSPTVVVEEPEGTEETEGEEKPAEEVPAEEPTEGGGGEETP